MMRRQKSITLMYKLTRILGIIFRFVRRRPIVSILFIPLVLFSVQFVKVCLRTHRYFGYGPTLEGGAYGRRIDNSIKRALFHWSVRSHRRVFYKYTGFALPETAEVAANAVGAPVLTQTWLAESVMRSQDRRNQVEKALAHAERFKPGSGATASCVGGTTTFEPRVLLPTLGDWYRSTDTWLPADDPTTTALHFDESEMDNWMRTHFSWLHEAAFGYLERLEQVQLWGICAVYQLGGIFVAPTVTTFEIQELVLSLQQGGKNCSAHYLSFHSEQQRDENDQPDRIRHLAATPGHAHLECVLSQLRSKIKDATARNVDMDWSDMLAVHWQRDSSCMLPQCCSTLPPNQKAGIVLLEPVKNLPTSDSTKPRFQVQINQESDAPLVTQPKESWGKRLAQAACWSGWFCNRCLRMPWHGSFSACRAVCRPCYQERICSVPDQQDVTVQVAVQEQAKSTAKRIPRIIHQTWFEDLTTDRYPHLQRLQNSWKASGWDYRFYTDSSSRTYIQKHFPDRFVQAYDAILPGAFKADLFRLLVLLREGGIYADIDVQLDTNLDEFITTDLSFFVPRDMAVDFWPNSNYCLWNGLMGAAPGHPVIAQAVEDLLNRILNRYDYFDMEGAVCRQDDNAEIWKLRSFPILLVTGPCALGISVNTALGRKNHVQGFQLGWQSTNATDNAAAPAAVTYDVAAWGDALLLSTDRYDLGELRFTDIDRNLLIGSSNQDRFARTPIHKTLKDKGQAPAHYSKANSDIIGEHGTYKDDLVANERIHVKVVRTVVPSN